MIFPTFLRIRFRFDRGFAFACASLVLALGLVIGVVNENALSQQKLQQLDVQARTLAQSVAAPLMFSDPAAARENAGALAENPNVDAVGVYGDTGALIASFERTGAAPPPLYSNPYGPRYRGAYLETERSVTRDGQTYGAVYMRLRRDPLLGRLARYAPIGLLVMMTALVLAVAGAAQDALSRAYRALEQRAADIAQSNERLTTEMESRKHAEEALVQSRKMEAIGQLTGGVAHDFNNLLMVVSGGLRMLQRHDSPERRAKTIEAMNHAVERGAGLTRQLLAFARRQPIKLETVAIDERINSMRPLLERSLRADILLDVSFPPGLPPVATDPGQLELAVLNLCVNARDAMATGGVITITGRKAVVPGYVEVLVRDTGAGIAPEILGRIFEPYFTTKPMGQGTGLGLSQVYGFVQQSGGSVRIESQVGAGTTIILALPISREAVLPPPVEPVSEGVDEHYRVLVVEDNDAVADTVCAMLEELGHQPQRARSANEALDVLQSANVDIVFSDIVMPGGKNGIELARELDVRAPGLPVLLTTGYSGNEEVEADRPVLRKPYQVQELRTALNALLRRAVTA